jgi:hypothetical protein
MTQHTDEPREPGPTGGSDAPAAEGSGQGITDQDLPEDLQPTDDNPLAQPLEGDDVKSPEELDVLGGKVPEQREQHDTTGPDDADG